MHDVGKMLIPHDILMKPGTLTAEEFAVMKQHTVFGYDILQKMEDSCQVIAEAALLHHERCNGQGYPQGRAQQAIPLESQIVAVADVFDAICSDRVYKTRISPFEAVRRLWEAACGGELNVQIVSRFINYIATGFVGSQAVLNTGEEVEVIMLHRDEPMRPLVRKQDTYLDLRRHRSLWIEKIVSSQA